MKRKYCITFGFKVLIFQFTLSFISLIVGCLWGLNVENEKWSQLIYSNIKIADMDVGGKTKQEARDIIKTQYIDTIANKTLNVTVDDKIYTINTSHFIKSYDMENVINAAFNFGKSLNIIEKHKLLRIGSNKIYILDFNCDDDLVKEFTTKIENETNKTPVDARIEIKSDGGIKIEEDIKGSTIEKEKLEKYIVEKIKSSANKDIHIEAPILRTSAVITKTELSLIDTCISSFNTSFKSSSFMRTNNIDISVKAIDGKLIFPGETFSFNDILGERTKERGYMEAPVIIDNKIESGLGGGICQVSSTLYNAILKSGIQDISRRNHSLPSTYVELGLDATVDWQNIDFKFTNTLGYPIYIEVHTQNKNLYINIFSNSDLNKKKYIIENDINEYKDVYKVKVSRKTYENGSLINSEIISNDIYSLSAPISKKRY